MNNLRDSSAKPRTKVRAPGYPRLLKAGLVAVLAACGGEVAPADGDGSNSLMNGDNGEQVEPDAGTSDPIMGGGMLPPYDEGDKGQDGTGGNPGWGDPEYGGGIGASYDPNEKGEGGTGGDPEEWPDVAVQTGCWSWREWRRTGVGLAGR